MTNEAENEKQDAYIDEKEDAINTVTPPSTADTEEHEKKEEKSPRSSSPSGDPLSPSDLEAARRVTSTTSERIASKVPRSQRRGLFANLCLIPEVDNSYFLPNSRKWWITFLVGLAAAAAPMGSAIVLPGLTQISRDFHSKAAVTNLNVALYMLSMSIFPLWWSSFSETFGRRSIYLWSFALFVLFAILSAKSKNIAMFIVMRVLSGGAGASVQALGGGTVADIWEPRERGRAMGIFYLGPLCGPLLSPIIGGALAQELGWRATQWYLVIYGAVVFVFIVLGLPETLKRRRIVEVELEVELEAELESEEDVNGPSSVKPALTRSTTRQSVKLKTKKFATILRRCLIDPLKIIMWLRFPAVALTVAYASIAFGVLYFLNISVQATFSAPPYNFPIIIVGLLYIPNSLGYLVCSIFGGRWIDHIMKREAKKANRYDEKGRLIVWPEDRMKENAWIAAIVFPGAILWYGWTAEKGVFWLVPLLANFFFGIGSMLVFSMATTMLTEFMPRKASNGLAVNNFVRNIFSCVGAVIGEPLIRAIGNGWMCTILAIIGLVVGFTVIISMKLNAEKWRIKMDEVMREKGM